jgi:acyl dehydratase
MSVEVSALGGRPDIVDQFGRTVASGWGTADTGQAWTVTGTASDFSVSTGQGRIAPSATDSSRHALAVMTANDVDVMCDVSVAQIPTGSDELAFVAARSNAAATARYRVLLAFATAGTLTATLQRVSGGSATSLGTLFSGAPFTAGVPWRVRLQCIGSTIRAKVWLVGTAEPGSWTSATDTVVTDGGFAGCQVYRNVGNTSADPMVFFDNFSVRALYPNVHDSFGRSVGDSWGTATSGHSWLILAGTASDYFVVGGQGWITANTLNTTYQISQVFAHQDVDMVCDLGMQGVQAGANTILAVAARASSGGTTHYRVSATFDTSGTVTFSIVRSVSGTASTLASAFASFGYQAGEMFRVRLQCVGSTIRAKAWAVGSAEPASWQASVTDTEIANGARVAVQAFRGTGNTTTDLAAMFDNFFVRPLRPAINDSFDRTVASGWGNLTSGQAWINSDSSKMSVGSGRGVMDPSAANQGISAALVAPAADIDIQATCYLPETPSGNTIGAYLIAKADGSNLVSTSNRYEVLAVFNTDGTVLTRLRSVVSGAATNLVTLQNNVAYTPGTGLNLRLRIVGSTLSAKAWFVGDAEPAWLSVVSASLTAAGWCGLGQYRLSGNTSTDDRLFFDDLQVVDLSRPLKLDTGVTSIDPSRLVTV